MLGQRQRRWKFFRTRLLLEMLLYHHLKIAVAKSDMLHYKQQKLI